MTHIALTMGDATGIGPEITAKLLHQHLDFLRDAHGLSQLTILGEMDALTEAMHQQGQSLPTDNINYFDTHNTKIGQASITALEEAVRLVMGKNAEADAIVTGPTNKKYFEEAGLPEGCGQTEIIAAIVEQITGEHHPPEMLFNIQDLNMLLLTRHVPLHEVSTKLTQKLCTRALLTLVDHLQNQEKIEHPRIVVMGCNPHAGEVGGHEEQKIITPSILQVIHQRTDVTIDGPRAADALMRGMTTHRPPYNAYVACYHDQGLIPMKLLGHMQCVNITIGLPLIRTSVSHGTAEDIAGRNKADASSLVAACKKAIQLVKAKKPIETND